MDEQKKKKLLRCVHCAYLIGLVSGFISSLLSSLFQTILLLEAEKYDKSSEGYIIVLVLTVLIWALE